MLFTGCEVRIEQNLAAGLECTAKVRTFKTRAQFFSIRTDPKPVNKVFIYIFCRSANVKKLQAKFIEPDTEYART